MSPLRVRHVAGLLVALGSTLLGEERDEASRRLDYMKQAIGRFEIQTADAKQAAKLHDPVLRWDDSVISVLDGIVAVWTEGGRPVATGGVWIRADGQTHHVFRSISEGIVTAKRGDDPVWHPQEPGIQFQTLADSPQPHASRAQRLNQMRSLARRFAGHVIDVTSEGGRIELRLMPQPVLRYEAPGAKIIDGGMFFLAKGTNPEVLLLLEAVELPGGGSRWRFAAAPQTNRELEVLFDDNVVFTSPYVMRPHDPNAASFDFVERGPPWKGNEP